MSNGIGLMKKIGLQYLVVNEINKKLFQVRQLWLCADDVFLLRTYSSSRKQSIVAQPKFCSRRSKS